MAQPKYTTVIHTARIKLAITCNEYCVADTIYHLSNNPSSKISGWCFASKETIARFMGISERGVYKIIDRLLEKELVEKDKETKWLRTTKKWYNTVVLMRIKLTNPEQSSYTVNKVQSSMNKVQKHTEQSSYNKNKYKNNYNKKGSEKVSSPICEPTYEEVKDTYKSKKQILEKKGLQYKPQKRTTKQQDTFIALRVMDYFRDNLRSEYPQLKMWTIQDKSRDKKIRQLVIRAYDILETEEQLKELINWWLKEGGDWCDFKPENCFTTATIESYLNKDKKTKKNNSLLDLK